MLKATRFHETAFVGAATGTANTMKSTAPLMLRLANVANASVSILYTMDNSKENQEMNDSLLDTNQHIRRVMELLNDAACELLRRANVHDLSKLEEPEKSGYDKVGVALIGITYGSEEYKKALSDLKPTIEHHYLMNSHHPEHHAEGVNGMDLFDLIEMFLDWKAAGERHKNGNILRSIEVNKERFKLSPQLCAILKNTATNLNWGMK